MAAVGLTEGGARCSARSDGQGVSARLSARRMEIDDAILARIRSVSTAAEPRDPEYADGLRASVRAAVDLGLAAIGRDEGSAPPVPTVLLDHARAAARNGVDLADVLRGYFAGYVLLCHFLVEEVDDSGLPEGSALTELLRVQASLFDRLVVAVTDEYRRERRRPPAVEQRRDELVGRLLAGELVDTSELGYRLDAHHLGVIARGAGATATVKRLAQALDCRLLAVHRDETTVWAWLGRRQRPDRRQLERVVATRWPTEIAVAIGEVGQGTAGWRRSHQQARAAFLVALRRPGSLVRYADVALVASMVQDDLLASSLHDLYLAPLGEERDGGSTLRDTLRAYFTAGRNGASAAAALNVSRQTVNNRLQVVEERIGRPLSACGAAIEAVLRFEELDRGAAQVSDELPTP